MNILLFSTVMHDAYFSSYQAEAKIKPNPSNQNFYSKLVKTFLIGNNVSVISKRPLVNGMFSKNSFDADFFAEKNLKFYYTKVQGNRSYKLLSETNEIVKTANKAIEDFVSKDFIIVVDSLNFTLVKAATKVAKKHNAKIVAMLTDNPSNLSRKHNFINNLLVKKVSNFDGFLSLTQGLANVFNSNKPSYIFDGLVTEETIGKGSPIIDYFYFAGSLYERYGVKDLIDAFHETNITSKLVIAGSGPLDKYIEKMSREDYRILYLSQVAKENNFAYMKNAIANINPRPLDTRLDDQSIPSKLLEYLSIGVPIISTKFHRFFGTFKDDVTWIDANGKDAIKEALERFVVSDINENKKKAITARRKVFEFYGLNVQAESINYFLASINSSTNDWVSFEIWKFSSK